MTVTHAWALALLALPVVWAAWEWRRTSSRPRLIAKTLSAAAILAALSEPVLETWETKVAVAVLADTSASVSEQDLARMSGLASRILDERGRHQVRILPFAGEVRAPLPGEFNGSPRLRPTPGAAGRSTNLEAAILEAAAGTPTGLLPRIVLISDGLENSGSLSRAAWQARELGIPIDTYALEGRPKPELAIESVRFPALAFAGERFPIELTVRSPRPAEGRVTLNAEGRPLGASTARLEEGLNQVRVFASLNLAGAFDISGELEAPGLGAIRFAHAVTIRSPKVLFISDDPEGTESHLFGAWRSGAFDIDKSRELEPGKLDRYQLVVLNNWDLEGETEAAKTAVEGYVRAGGGLLVIGGERNVYVEDREKREDPLEQTLPARLVPPKSPEGTCVVLIVDKSSSMEGRKMELARLSAIGVIDNLRPVDRIGVLIFDNSFQWAVPIRKADNRTLIKRLIAGITPDGGTQIAPALAEAYRRVAPVQATFKHIVLLTDGISEEGDSMILAREAAANRVTISTVGLGQDVNKSFLEKVAQFAQGKSYFLTDPSGLAQILLRDVLEHTGQTTVEKPVTPVPVGDSSLLAAFPEGGFPTLQGYVRFESKLGAETILKLEEDPLLSRWQYGLGRAAVFASDAKSRWAESWVSWSGFDTFWLNLARDLLPHAVSRQAEILFDRANRRLVVDYRLTDASRGDRRPIPELYVVGPGDFRQTMGLEKVADGAYRGVVDVGSRQGLFRVRALENSEEFPETGIYLEEEELNEYGADAGALRSLSQFTGGRFEPQPSQVFDTAGRAVPMRMPLWPALLALAILLGLGELILRKWRTIWG